ncbi:MAG: leucine--tRNA ligase [Thermoprotei archaeon]|jgi:leucyl-tRNA synthetase
MPEKYDFQTIEEKWLKNWEKDKIFEAEPDSRKKFLITFPFPYMSGPLHAGHLYTSIRADTYARYKRMRGYNVLYPWAWHWTGEPITGMVKRIIAKDPAMIHVILDIDKVPPDEIQKFTDPIYVARYYTERGKKDLQRLGLSIDWRREFTTTSYNIGFNKFVEWQFRKLKSMNYITIASHPVVWCPRDQSPTGDHDRLAGEGIGPEKYYLMKFKLNDETYLVAATFRPETIFGVTNIWINPDVSYVLCKVDNEQWVVSKETVQKLIEQNRVVTIIKEFMGREFIGKTVEEPINHRKIYILPALFVDPWLGTGIVYSVPAHAPYDWLALRDLKIKKEIMKNYNADPNILDSIHPISIIRVEKFGEYPAIEIVDKMNIKDQRDQNAEEATKIIYKEEFHKGRMKENCGKYAGLTVKDAKEKVVNDLSAQKIIDYLYDLPEPVICRCGTRCIVKILKDQWFLKYSDDEWKTKARECVKSMNFYPEEARNWLLNTVDWLEDKACARRSGLGTPLPWAKDWIIEPLSDSTIYMVFYMISKYINVGMLDPNKLNDEFFDYVILGKGNPEHVAEITKIDASLIKQIRKDVLYWYPVDMRVSGKDLLSNHLAFFVFHHVAIFDKSMWPRGIAANGFVTINGQRLSKSKGIIITISDALNNYGSDATRLFMLSAAEDLDDPDWSDKGAKETLENIEKLYTTILNIINNIKNNTAPSNEQIDTIDKWLLSTLQKRIIQTTEYMENFKLRSAAITAIYEMWNDLKWYLKRTDQPKKNILKTFIETWIRLMTPFTPFIAEELWEKLGNNKYVSLTSWPEPNNLLIDEMSETIEEQIKIITQDIKTILTQYTTNISKIYVYLPAKWKYQIATLIGEKLATETDPRTLMKELMKNPEYRQKSSTIATFIDKFINIYWSFSELHKKMISKAEIIDKKALESMKKLIKEELNAELIIDYEENQNLYDPTKKAQRSIPFKPAIYIE